MKERLVGPGGIERLADFDRYFELSLAFSKELREKVYQIRYRVYCEEFGYEPESIFSTHKEVDEFDRHSVHCLVTHRETGLPAGCVRLVLVGEGEKMPMEAHAGPSLDRQFMERFARLRPSCCEVSRLAVDGAFRRRRCEWETRFGFIDEMTFTERERRVFPMIAMALFLSAASVADLINRNHLFAIMEPVLPRLLSKTGIQFQKIGRNFDFRGTRAPYYGNLNVLAGKAPLELRQAFEVVKRDFTEEIHPLQGIQALNSRVIQATRPPTASGASAGQALPPGRPAALMGIFP